LETENVNETDEVTMEHELPLGLSRNRTYAPLTASDLEMLGKRASDMYLRKEASLNDAVSQLAGQHAGISPEQIKRVVEFANQNTFQSIFEKQAGDKNVEFDLADPGVVIRELNDGARPAVYNPVPEEYGREPVKTSSAVLTDLELFQIFGVQPSTPAIEKSAEDRTAFLKEASARLRAGDDSGLVERDLAAATSLQTIKQAEFSYPTDSHYNELAAYRTRLVKMAEDADYAADKNRRLTKEAMGNLVELVRQDVLGGTELGDVVQALSSVPTDRALLKTAMTEIVNDLIVHDFDPVKLQAGLLHYRMTKEATVRVPNLQNPTIKTFAAFAKLASEQPVLDESVQSIANLLTKVDATVAEVLRAR